MKGIYQDIIVVEVKERVNNLVRIETAYGSFTVKDDEVVIIPDEIYAREAERLEELKNYILAGHQKKEEIKHSYLTKKEEIDDAITKAKVERDAIIQRMKAEVLMMCRGGNQAC